MTSKFLSHVKINLYLNEAFFANIVAASFNMAISKKGNGTGNGMGNGMGSGNGKVMRYVEW